MSLPARIARRLRRSGGGPAVLARDERGAIAVMTALCLSVLLGFVSLAVEATNWEMTQLAEQTAADRAANAAGFLLGSASLSKEAKGVAAANGFTDGVASTTVIVNQPPANGNYTSNTSAIEVIVSRQQARLISSLFLSGNTQTISARAVAVPLTDPVCVLALDPSSSGTINASGGATITANGCDFRNNSSSTTDTTLSGGAVINASSVYLTGNYSASGGSSIAVTGTLKTSAAAASDPYASRTIPTYSGCSASTGTYTGTISAATGVPYVFCGGLTVGNGGSVGTDCTGYSGQLKLTQGVYIIDGGNFTIPGGTCLTATGGVTIILTSSAGNSYGIITVSGSGKFLITAPSTGATAGLAVWMDKNAPLNTTYDTFSGQTNETIQGAIYAPSQKVEYSGSTQNTGGCTQLVAYQVNFTGSATFAHNCTGLGTSDPNMAGAAQLVE